MLQSHIPPSSDSFRIWESLALQYSLTHRNGNLFLGKGPIILFLV